MSDYIKTFSTRSDFKTWRSSLSSASYKGSYCVRITEADESLSFSINISKPIQQAGLGDFIVYDSVDECFKAFPQSILSCKRTSTSLGDSTTNLTGLYCKLSEVYTSGLSNCTALGTVIDKAGSVLKIAAIQDGTGKPWYGTSSAYSLLLDNVHTSTALRNGKGGTYWTGSWDWFLTNHYYSTNESYVGYWIGVTRAAWNTAVAAHKDGSGTGAVTATGQIAGTYYVQDYNYDYDLFQRRTIIMRYPGVSTDANAVLNGHDQTRKIVDALYTQASLARTDVTTAAGYCFNYAKSVTGFGAGSWWLPTPEEAIKINKTRASIGLGSYWYIWTCVQYSATVAWYVNNDGRVSNYPKYDSNYAVPVSALDTKNL